MCGFFGISSKNLNYLSSSFNNNRLKLRGPDAECFRKSVNGNLRVIHNRLSIVDLSNAANQPMVNEEDESKWIVFNGELYNHIELRNQLINRGVKFKTNSDTEVLLKGICLEKELFLKKISGPFAFAFVDEKSNSLLLARDATGEKPLFFNRTEKGLAFGSDLIQVANAFNEKNKISLNSFYEYFMLGSPIFPNTILEKVFQLLPGHYLYISLEDNILNYQKPFFKYQRNKDSIIRKNDSYLREEFKTIFFDSIKKQFTCDREVALLLSGGIDSSLVAAASARNISKVNTFTVKFKDKNCIQDVKNARLIANHFSTNHTEIDIEEATPFLFEKILKDLDCPISDPSLIPSYLIFSRLSKNFTVALSGDGADELFGGYNHYLYMKYIKSFNYLFKNLPEISDEWISRNVKPSVRGRNWLKILGRDLKKKPLFVRQLLLQNEVNNLILNDYTYIKEINPFTSNFDGSVILNGLKLDFYDYMSSIVLQKTDRASMQNSVESRSPFLDKEVINFSLNLSEDCLVDYFSRKKLLQYLADDLLPKNIRKLQKRKFGFSFSTNILFRKKIWYEYTLSTFENSHIIFNKKNLKNILRRNLTGENYGQLLYSSLMLIKWMDIHKIDI